MNLLLLKKAIILAIIPALVISIFNWWFISYKSYYDGVDRRINNENRHFIAVVNKVFNSNDSLDEQMRLFLLFIEDSNNGILIKNNMGQILFDKPFNSSYLNSETKVVKNAIKINNENYDYIYTYNARPSVLDATLRAITFSVLPDFFTDKEWSLNKFTTNFIKYRWINRSINLWVSFIGSFFIITIVIYFILKKEQEKQIALKQLEYVENIKNQTLDELEKLKYIYQITENQNSETINKLIDKLQEKEALGKCNVEVLENEQIRDKFLEVFNIAKSEINIQSPWITNYVVDGNFIKHMRNALTNGVKIKILYGYKDNPDLAKTSDIFAEKLRKEFRNFGDNFKVAKDNTHIKMLICDDLFIGTGSYNFLSFGGIYKNSDVRKEILVCLDSKEQIEENRRRYFNF